MACAIAIFLCVASSAAVAATHKAINIENSQSCTLAYHFGAFDGIDTSPGETTLPQTPIIVPGINWSKDYAVDTTGDFFDHPHFYFWVTHPGSTVRVASGEIIEANGVMVVNNDHNVCQIKGGTFAYQQTFSGDEKAADQAAVDAMRTAFDSLYIDGTVVIGEGERYEAPMLYIGEPVGCGEGPKVDIALDPLEGTSITAKGGPNALAVIAMAEHNGFLNAPDTYMQKIAAGVEGSDVIDLDASVADSLHSLAQAKKTTVGSLVVCILDRSRHETIIQEVREAGARIALINDGDVSAVIATAQPDSGIDMYIGTGGAPEGVLAAAALRCIGGQMQGRLVFLHEAEKTRAQSYGITDFAKKYYLHDLADGEIMFAATGVTTGTMLQGVRTFPGGAKTHSIVMRSKTKTLREINTTHYFG